MNEELLESPTLVETSDSEKEQKIEVIEENHDTVEMSVILSADEYAILTNEFPLFEASNNDSFLRKLILYREAVLNTIRPPIPPSVSEPQSEVVEAQTTENVELKETAKVLKEIVKLKTKPEINKGWMIAIAILVVIIILGLIFWAIRSKNKTTQVTGEIVKKTLAFDTNGLDI